MEEGKMMASEMLRSVETEGAAVAEDSCKGMAAHPVPPGGGDNAKNHGSECQICHLESDLELADGSELILLGCDCRGELGTAHRNCGEAWFKLRGNIYYEICGILTKDSILEYWNANRMLLHSSRKPNRSYWRERPICKFVMVCLVIAFIFPWFLKGYSDLNENPLIVLLKVLHGHTKTGGRGLMDYKFNPKKPWLFTAGTNSPIKLYYN